jgi:hypothetical protein
MVLANVSTYKEWVNWETCLKLTENTPRDWLRQLTWMVEHPVERKKLATRAYNQVIKNNSADTYIWERAYVYYEVYRQIAGKPHPYAPVIEQGLQERGIFKKEVV